MKGKLSIIIYNGMACICSSLESDNDIRFLGQHIRYLPFPFISPVSSHNRFNHLAVPPVVLNFLTCFLHYWFIIVHHQIIFNGNFRQNTFFMRAGLLFSHHARGYFST